MIFYTLYNMWNTECTLSQKNDTDLAHDNFNACQPIFIIFGRDIAEWIGY